MGVTPPIIPDLLDLFPDVVAVRQVSSGPDTRGAKNYGPSVNRQCRIAMRNSRRTDSHGNVFISTMQITFAGAFGLSVNDEYTLPARYAQRTPQAKDVYVASDENGPHHERVFF